MKHIKPILFILFILLFVASCSKKASEKTALEKRTEIMSSSQTFVGTIPCADCEGIKINLTLTYYLDRSQKYSEKIQYLGKSSEIFTYQSAWAQSGDIVTLLGSDGQPREKWQFIKGDAPNNLFTPLIKLDENGKPIKSNLNYTLKMTALFQGL